MAIPIDIPGRRRTGGHRRPSHMAYQSCYSPVAEFIHSPMLVTCLDSTCKKIYLDLRNLCLCVVRASGGMSIALDEGQ
jgi:hypothetical protein